MLRALCVGRAQVPWPNVSGLPRLLTMSMQLSLVLKSTAVAWSGLCPASTLIASRNHGNPFNPSGLNSTAAGHNADCRNNCRILNVVATLDSLFLECSRGSKNFIARSCSTGAQLHLYIVHMAYVYGWLYTVYLEVGVMLKWDGLSWID